MGNGSSRGISSLKRDSTSNFGHIVKHWEQGNDVSAGGYKMSGTSQAAAIFTRKLINGG